MNTDFIWTDELAQEFAEQYRFSSSRISIEQFKESKQPKPDTEKCQSAQQLVERYEKIIEQINNMSFIKGIPGATWGDTEYDSLAAAAGYNQAIMNMKEMILKALTPKTGSDE